MHFLNLSGLPKTEKLVDVVGEFQGAGLVTVAISSNSIQTHPQVSN